MKRRAALKTLLSAGAVSAVAPEAKAQALSPSSVGEMLRVLGGVEPLPGEEDQARAFLLSLRPPAGGDPRVEPAIGFDPEVDP